MSEEESVATEKEMEDSTSSRNISDRRKHILMGSGVVFFISLGVLIPLVGLLIGWVFTLGGGFAGGATVGFLRSEGGRAGAKYGAIVALLGGIPSSIIGVIGGTLGNAAIMSQNGGTGAGEMGGQLLIFAMIGLISGIVFKIAGGVFGGGLVGWFFDEEAH